MCSQEGSGGGFCDCYVPATGKCGDFGVFGVLQGDVCMRKKVCSHDFGMLGSVLDGFGVILRSWWHFLVARKRALEGFCDCYMTYKGEMWRFWRLWGCLRAMFV